MTRSDSNLISVEVQFGCRKGGRGIGNVGDEIAGQIQKIHVRQVAEARGEHGQLVTAATRDTKNVSHQIEITHISTRSRCFVHHLSEEVRTGHTKKR